MRMLFQTQRNIMIKNLELIFITRGKFDII